MQNPKLRNFKLFEFFDHTGSRLTYRLQYHPRLCLCDLINYPLLCTYGVRQIKKMLKSYNQSPWVLDQ